MTKSDRRRLVAVVYADMVGYSRLVGLDDVGTLRRLGTLRSAVIDPAIEENGGRIVKTGGDSFLMVFDSVDGAVRCAVTVQKAIPSHDDQPLDRAIRFRIGINVGDVIPDGADLHGDVVNVAARLQAECPAGAICVTRAVRDHMRDRLGIPFVELGPLHLKNIARPIEAFVLGPDTVAAADERRDNSPVDMLPLPGKPSVAVLPFANLSGDPSQEHFSDGVADDIITELSRNRLLFVIARTSSFSYKGRPTDVKTIGRELGVRYVVEGNVRRTSDRIRVAAQLVDADTGNHIWSERYDRKVSDVFAVNDEITRAMLAAIQPAISHSERERARRKPPDKLSAWEAYQRAYVGWSLTPDFSVHMEFLRRAVALDPGFSQAHASLSSGHLHETTLGLRPVDEGLRLAEAEARCAVELDSENAAAHAALSWALDHQGDWRAAMELAEIAIDLNHNEPRGYIAKGHVMVFSGHFDVAGDFLSTATRLDPRGPNAMAVMVHVQCIHYFARDYLAAETIGRRIIRTYPKAPRAYVWLAATLGQLGRVDEARTTLARTIEISPSHFKFVTASRPGYHHRLEDYEHLLEGLRIAGWAGNDDRGI